MKNLILRTISLLMIAVMVAAFVPVTDVFAGNSTGDSEKDPGVVRVGITYHNQTITAALESCGAEVVLLPTVKTRAAARKQLSGISAIVFPGGRPVAPKRYGEENLYSKRVNKVRDRQNLRYRYPIPSGGHDGPG